MRFFLAVFTLLMLTVSGFTQHTFSIVAIDTSTGEVGSAGATCLSDSPLTPGGALIISDIIPGKGAIHTQALWVPTNQANARIRMEAGDSPQEIIDWLIANDADADPTVRQYGIVDVDDFGMPRVAAHTGANCMDWKGDITGFTYSIQGNILLGFSILDQMEVEFVLTDGDLADKLMASLQGANVIGADTRCFSFNKSSLSAFIRVAKPGDDPDSLYLDLVVGNTPFNGIDPIDSLNNLFDEWKSNLPPDTMSTSIAPTGKHPVEILAAPNPAKDVVRITLSGLQPGGTYSLEVYDLSGKICDTRVIEARDVELDTAILPNGLYILRLYRDGRIVAHQKILIEK